MSYRLPHDRFCRLCSEETAKTGLALPYEVALLPLPLPPLPRTLCVLTFWCQLLVDQTSNAGATNKKEAWVCPSSVAALGILSPPQWNICGYFIIGRYVHSNRKYIAWYSLLIMTTHIICGSFGNSASSFSGSSQASKASANLMCTAAIVSFFCYQLYLAIQL